MPDEKGAVVVLDADPIARDERGHFLPGQAPKSTGRPKGSLTRLNKQVKEEIAEEHQVRAQASSTCDPARHCRERRHPRQH